MIKFKNKNEGKATFYAAFSEQDNRKSLIKVIDKTGFNWIQIRDKQDQKNTKGMFPTTMVFSMISYQGNYCLKKQEC